MQCDQTEETTQVGTNPTSGSDQVKALVTAAGLTSGGNTSGSGFGRGQSHTTSNGSGIAGSHTPTSGYRCREVETQCNALDLQLKKKMETAEALEKHLVTIERLMLKNNSTQVKTAVAESIKLVKQLKRDLTETERRQGQLVKELSIQKGGKSVSLKQHGPGVQMLPLMEHSPASRKRSAENPDENTDTPTKKLKQGGGNSKPRPEDTEWRIATSRKKKQERTPAKKPKVPGQVNGKGRPEKKIKKNTGRSTRNAVLIKPKEGQSYSEVLKKLKESVDPGQTEAQIKNVQKTKDGSILVKLGKGTKDMDAFNRNVKEAVDQIAEVKDLTTKATLEILDIDCLTEDQEVIEVLKRETGIEADLNVHVFPPNKREQRLAVLNIEEKVAQMLLKKERIKIGWINCRVRRRISVPRCHRCLGYGHLKNDCDGTDRSKACWKCGTEGHTAKTCKEANNCFLCKEQKVSGNTQHLPGTGLCSIFRKALERTKNDRQGPKWK